ncbi:MAG TPA: molybdenum cofactor biosynthesis protein MoaE [Gemmatimonadaceae bacterium]|nr:molybdenum cofactor biosynthesis protein MoaE [Gemmatimonadaceae bacterium]
MSIRTAIVRRAIDVAALLAEVENTANGATVVFLGQVRETNDGRAVTGIEYSAYGEMAERELASIAGECAAAFGIAHLVAEHRLGVLELGDTSIAIVLAHPHRAEAYEASRFVIEEVKRRLPIWKREGYADGASEWVNASGVAQENTTTEHRS